MIANWRLVRLSTSSIQAYNHGRFETDRHYKRLNGRVPTTGRKNSDKFRPARAGGFLTLMAANEDRKEASFPKLIDGAEKPSLLQFGPFTLDLQRHGLYVDGKRVHLTSKPFETLAEKSVVTLPLLPKAKEPSRL